MSPSRAPADVLASTVCHSLYEAAERASIALATTGGTPTEDVRRQLDGVARLVLQAGVREWGQSDATAAPVVPRRHLDALRSEFLRQLRRKPQHVDGQELVRVLSAMEEIGSRGEATNPEDSIERPASSDALAALIEVAHDMRSPLTSILFLVDAIRRGQSGAVTAVQERQLGLIYGAALGLSTLACDVIDGVHGDRLVDGRPGPFSIAEVVLGVCAVVRPVGEEKRVPIDVTLPDGDGRIGYAAAICRVLLNLTTNALRYTDSGSVSIGCTELSATRIEFWVHDTGRGVPEDVLTMPFNGLRQGRVGARFSGAGLGLAICRSLLKKMSSSLRVATAMGHGTRFSFEMDLPRA